MRLILTQERQLGGIVEADDLFIGGAPRSDADQPRLGRGRKGQRRTTKTPVLGAVERPLDLTPGAPAGQVRARVVENLSYRKAVRVLEETVEPTAHLMSDEAKTFMALGEGFAAHDTVCHSRREYVHGLVHTNAAEGFNDRVRRTITGVFHHISPQHTDLYLGEIGFRWSQRSVAGQALRRTRKGRSTVRTLWTRTPAALQLHTALRSIIGRQMRRTPNGGIEIKSTIAVFG